MTDTNPPNKNNLEIAKKKIETMLSKTKEELHSLEVEWLHLRSLALRDEHASNKPESKPSLRSTETNFDDINSINSQQFNINSNELECSKKQNNGCESESEEDL